MSCFYHVTSQKSTSVSHSFTCNFTGSNELNLIVGKLFYFEVYLIAPEGLRLLKELPINGRISAAVSFRRNGCKQDSIIVVTEKADAAIIDCVKREDDRLDFVTFANGNIGDNCSISSDGKHEIIVDPTSQIILFKFFDGVFKAILMKDLMKENGDTAITNNQSLNVVAFRVEDGNIRGIFSLYGSTDCATIGLFVEDNKILNMKSFKMSFNQIEVTPDDWKIDSLPPDTQFIIAVPPPYCGLLIVGNKHVVYYNRHDVQISTEVPVQKTSTIVCFEMIDMNQYLLGDMLGQLFIMHLYHEGPSTSTSNLEMPNTLRIVKIGEVTIPETITYLDNGVVFIGSQIGDSLLIKLINSTTPYNTSDPDKTRVLPGSNSISLQVLQTYTNVGPIVDIELMEVNGQNQLLLCSGAYKEGSIKIVRNGIGIHELLVLDVPKIKEVWFLTLANNLHLLAVSWFSKTALLKLDPQNLSCLVCEGLDQQCISCLVSVVGSDKKVDEQTNQTIVQVTSRQIRLIQLNYNNIDNVVASQLVNVWTSADVSDLGEISLACYDGLNDLVVICGDQIVHLNIGPTFISFVGSYKLPHQVACIHTNPCLPGIVAVCYWLDNSVALIDLSSLSVVLTQSLYSSGVVARSLLLVQFQHYQNPQHQQLPYLMIGMNNGNLIYFQIDTDALARKKYNEVLSEQRRVTIGTGPYMNLSIWQNQPASSTSSSSCVFVCSNHPSIIHCSDNRLLFSSINLKNEVVAMSPLHTSYYPHCLVLLSESSVIIGSIDKIQKLHVRSIPLGESPRRMAIQLNQGSNIITNNSSVVGSTENQCRLAVLTMRADTYSDGVFRPNTYNGSLTKSITTNPRINKTFSIAPENINKRSLQRKLRDVESSHMVIMNQTLMVPVHIHSFYCSEDIVEQAVCITTMLLPISIVTQKIVSHNSTTTVLGSIQDQTASVNSPPAVGSSSFGHDNSQFDDPMIGGSSSVAASSGNTSATASNVDCTVKYVPVFIVGTTYITDDEKEPTHGALYLFYYNERTNQCNILKKIRLPGTPFAMQPFDENTSRLLITINSSVQLIDLTKDSTEPSIVCRYDDTIMALYLKRKDDFVLVGDLMRSVTLLRYKPNMALFEMIAQHRAPHWTTAVEFIDDDKFLVAEAEMNIFVVSRDFDIGLPPVSTTSSTGGSAATATIIATTPTTESSSTSTFTNRINYGPNAGASNREERSRLQDYASMHVGLIINKFLCGNILMQPLLDELNCIQLKNSILYGSSAGTIGQVFEIPNQLYTFLKLVEAQMQAVLVPIGNFSHETWRSFVRIKHCRVSERFIDGDLVENYQNLQLSDQQKIVKTLHIPNDFSCESAGFKKCTVEDLCRVIEELSRFH